MTVLWPPSWQLTQTRLVASAAAAATWQEQVVVAIETALLPLLLPLLLHGHLVERCSTHPVHLRELQKAIYSCGDCSL